MKQHEQEVAALEASFDAEETRHTAEIVKKLNEEHMDDVQQAHRALLDKVRLLGFPLQFLGFLLQLLVVLLHLLGVLLRLQVSCCFGWLLLSMVIICHNRSSRMSLFDDLFL